MDSKRNSRRAHSEEKRTGRARQGVKAAWNEKTGSFRVEGESIVAQKKESERVPFLF